MRGLEIVLLLVALATAVAAVAGRYNVPAPSLLVVAGLAVAFIPGVPAVQVPPDVVSVVVLPPLLYAAGQDLPWRELRTVWRPVTALAIGLVIASAAAVGAVASAVMGLPASMALVLGAVLASTDPVAVTALGRELPLPARLQVHAVYDTVVFILESVVFILIGLQLPTLIRAGGFGDWTWGAEALAIAAVLLAVRAGWVFPLSVAAQTRRGDRISWRIPAIVSWAGARGVLPLAAALSIPLTAIDGTPLHGRNHVVLLTTAVIVITLLVQGFTLGPLVRRAGVATPAARARHDTLTARSAMRAAALNHLDNLEQLEAAPPAAIVHLRRILGAQLTADTSGHRRLRHRRDGPTPPTP